MSTPFSYGTSRGPSREGWAAAAAVVGGVIWAILPIVFNYDDVIYSIDILDPFDPSILPALAVPLLILGVRGFYERYADAYSLWGRGGLWAIGLGLVGLWPFGLLEFLRIYLGISVSFGLGFGAYFLAIGAAIFVGLGAIGVGIDSWKTGRPSKWMGVWFPLALPVSALVNVWAAHLNDFIWMGNHYYSGLFGLAWIGLGYYLLRDR